MCDKICLRNVTFLLIGLSMNCNKKRFFCIIISELSLHTDIVNVKTTDVGLTAAMICVTI